MWKWYFTCEQGCLFPHFPFVLHSKNEPDHLHLFPIFLSELLIYLFLSLSPPLLPTSLPSAFVPPSHQQQGSATLFSVCGLRRFLLLEAFLIFCSLKFFFSLKSVRLCRSYPPLSRAALSTSPLLNAPPPLFLLSHLSFIAYAKPEISASVAAALLCVRVFHYEYTHRHKRMLIMELIEFSWASKVHSASVCVCVCECFLVCVCVCGDNINEISVPLHSTLMILSSPWLFLPHMRKCRKSVLQCFGLMRQMDPFKAWGERKLQHLLKCISLCFPSQKCLIQILRRGGVTDRYSQTLNLHTHAHSLAACEGESGPCSACYIMNLIYNIWNDVISCKNECMCVLILWSTAESHI